MGRDPVSADAQRDDSIPPGRSWLWAHIGRLAGLAIALVSIAFLALLAFVGFRPAEGLLVFLIAVFIMIALGGRLHGL